MEHILIHCAEYIDICDSCFNANTMRELFGLVPLVKIISFIQRAMSSYIYFNGDYVISLFVSLFPHDFTHSLYIYYILTEFVSFRTLFTD